MTDPGIRTRPEYPSGVLNKVCEILDRNNLSLKYIVQTHWHGRTVKGINLITALYQVGDASIPVAFDAAEGQP